jgi:putative membrane protein
MKKTVWLLAAICSLSACTKEESANVAAVNDEDRQFVQKASYTNLGEMDMGALAREKGNDTSAWYGDMMFRDHQGAQETLKLTAASQNITVPATTDSAHMMMQQQLMMKSGMAFDSAYLHMQAQGHMEAVTLFQREIEMGNNESIRAYARKYLGVIQRHKAMADSLTR